MIRNFWALPAALRLAIATQVPFSVQNDILAYPQYEIVYSESFIPEADAHRILSDQDSKRDPLNYSPDANHDVQAHYQTEDDAPPPPDSLDTYERLFFDEIPYLCTIPYGAPSDTKTTTQSEEEHQRELSRASEHGLELLQGMQDQCLYYVAGWWVYSFCYNQGIKQFHPLPPGRAGVPIFPPQEDSNIPSFVLGKFEASPSHTDAEAPGRDSGHTISSDTNTDSSGAPSSKALTPTLQTTGSTTYLTQHLHNGTLCDLTGTPRTIEVQFHCNPSSADHIKLIRETASCVYLMVIHTPRLCNDVAFLPPQVEKPNQISCREIVAKEGEEEWKAWRASVFEERVREMERIAQSPGKEGQGQGKGQGTIQPDGSSILQTPLTIGGITVGAQTLVGGHPSRTITPSTIVTNPHRVGPDGDKWLATLATSDGKTTEFMSEKEMDARGFRQVREEADRWKKQVRNVETAGVAWRLELWRMGNGVEEFRMIIGDQGEKEGDRDRGGDGGGGGNGGVDGEKGGEESVSVSGGEEGQAKEEGEQKPAVGGEEGSEEEFKT